MSVTSEVENGCPAASLAAAGCCKSEFIAILAHELRHPLAPLRSGLDFLRSGGGNDPLAMTKTLDIMARQVSQLTQLVDDLFDVVGISSGKVGLKKKRVELHSVLWNAVETSLPVIDAAGHHLVLDIPDTSWGIDADAGRITQVVVNLLNNAAKYTPAGGCIKLAVRQEERQVLISVTDDGVGIAEAAFGAIFEMFTQADQGGGGRAPGGLGIGLSLVRQLVELHGGTVGVASAGLGLGSTFTVALPLAPADALAPADVKTSAAPPEAGGPQPEEPPPARSQSLRMLIVDDHADAGQMLATLLALDGHTTAVVCDGPQALQMAVAFRPEVVFLDIEMPGMNGYETAQAMRQLAGLEPMALVALTGWDDMKSRHRAREAGFDHHLSKPTALATIRKVVSRIADSLAGA